MHQTQPPSREEFAELVAERLFFLGVDCQIQFRRDENALVLRQTETGQLIRRAVLEPLYDLLAHGDQSIEEVTELTVQSITIGIPNLPQKFAWSKQNVLLRVMSRWVLEKSITKLEQSAKLDGVPAHTDVQRGLMGDHIVHQIVHPFGEGFSRPVLEKHLKEWGTSFGDVCYQATTNVLKYSSNKFESYRLDNVDQCHMSCGESYDDSVYAFADNLQLSVPGKRVFLFLSRDRMMVFGDESNLSYVFGYAMLKWRHAGEQPDSLPPFPIIQRAGEYVDWVPSVKGRAEDDRAALILLRSYQHRYLARIYREQAEMLQDQLAKDMRGVRIAELNLLEGESNSPITCTSVFSDSVSTLLPKSDLVSFESRDHDQTRIVLQATWKTASRILGDRFLRQSYYPQRYLLTGFPSTKELEQITQHATEA